MIFDLEQSIRRLRETIFRYPMGQHVAHCGSEQRGVITGCQVCIDGSVMLSVSFGPGGSNICFPAELRLDEERWATASA